MNKGEKSWLMQLLQKDHQRRSVECYFFFSFGQTNCGRFIYFITKISGQTFGRFIKELLKLISTPCFPNTGTRFAILCRKNRENASACRRSADNGLCFCPESLRICGLGV